MYKIIATASLLSLIAFSGPVFGDAATQMPICTGCHGADGAGGPMPDVPIIAGIDALVQEDALFAYRDGGNECWPPGMMCQIAATLTDDDIVALSAHFAALPFKPAAEDFDAALAAEGEEAHENSCGMCHGMHAPDDPASSILHGQKIAYLRAAIQQYATGKREQQPAMKAMIDALTPEQTEAIINYYASYREMP